MKAITTVIIVIYHSFIVFSASDKNNPPAIEKNNSATEKFVKWAKTEFLLCLEKKEKLEEIHSKFSVISQHLEGISAQSIKKNKRFFGDLQDFKLQFKKVLYLQGKYAVEKKWPLKKLSEIKKRLDDLNAEKEFSAPLLMGLGEYDLYFKRYRELIEIYDSNPKRLVFKPQMPPQLIVKDNCSVNTLHNIVAIYEISKKNYWSPSEETENKILLKIADVYQKNQLDSYALAALNLASKDNRNEVFNHKIELLQKKLEKGSEITTGDDLY
jgi:hypothetical protein